MKRRTFSPPIIFLLFASIALIAIPFAVGSSPQPVNDTGTILGQVLLSPICPVERIPPDPACAPKPYKTSINILKKPNNSTYKKISSNGLGNFNVALPPGAYLLHATSGKIFPRCADVVVKVISKKWLKIKINCDTGIR